MRVKTKVIDPIDADPDGISTLASAAGAGTLDINGALALDGVYTGENARRIGILSTGDDSLVTFTVTGTDGDNKDISESLAGSSGAPGTVKTDAYFGSVTEVSISAASASTVAVGTVDELVTNTIPLDRINHNAATISVEDITGDINYTVEETFSDMQNADVFEFYEVSQLTARTSAGLQDLNNHASGVRLRINSYTSGADLKMVINQDRVR